LSAVRREPQVRGDRRPDDHDSGETDEHEASPTAFSRRPAGGGHDEEAALGRLLVPIELLQRLEDEAQEAPPVRRGRG
jgi:hypothetical protein